MKRKADTDLDVSSKKRAIDSDDIHNRFRDGFFDQKALDQYTLDYTTSKP
jgi:hypothetical protein